MPKLACPCGFVHNLSPIPDEGWITIRDRDHEPLMDAVIKHQANPADKEAERDADLKCSSSIGRLYECPTCGRIMWKRAREKTYRVYIPEDHSGA